MEVKHNRQSDSRFQDECHVQFQWSERDVLFHAPSVFVLVFLANKCTIHSASWIPRFTHIERMSRSHEPVSAVAFADQAHKPVAERHRLDGISTPPHCFGGLAVTGLSTVFDLREWRQIRLPCKGDRKTVRVRIEFQYLKCSPQGH
jgi:hypothetical protein